MAYAGGPGSMTTPHQPDVYNTNAKQILVMRDPVYRHPSIKTAVIVGRQPPTYFVLSVVMAFMNPLIGPVALIFSILSDRAFKKGDLKFADKWSQYAFLTSMITIIATLVIGIAVFFALSTIGYRGGHSY